MGCPCHKSRGESAIDQEMKCHEHREVTAILQKTLLRPAEEPPVTAEPGAEERAAGVKLLKGLIFNPTVAQIKLQEVSHRMTELEKRGIMESQNYLGWKGP